MKIKRIFKRLINWKLFVFIACIYSCKPSFKDTSWDTDISVPIAYGELALINLISDTLIRPQADHSLILAYRNNLIGLNVDSIVNIPDTSLTSRFQLPLNIKLPPGFTFYDKTEQSKYKINNAELFRATIQSGILRFKVTSSLREKTDIIYSMPCAVKNGQPFTFTTTLDAAPENSTTVYSRDFDMSGYTIDLTGTSHNSYNTFYYRVTAKISANADTATLGPLDFLEVENSLISISPNYTKGYFGDGLTAFGPSISDLTMFKNYKSGSLNFDEATIKLSLENYIGADATIKFNQLSSINSKTGKDIPLNNPLIGNIIEVNRAIDNGGTVSPTKYETTLNKSNSNITALLNNSPDGFKYAMDLNLNPLGNTSGGNDFIYSNKTFDAIMDVRIPLKLSFNDLLLEDTLSINTGNISNKEKVNTSELTLYFENGMPFSATINAAIYTPAVSNETLITGAFLKAAASSNGIVVNPESSTLTITLDNFKTQKLLNSSFIIISALLNTNEQPDLLTFYDNYNIKFKASVHLNYTLSSSEK